MLSASARDGASAHERALATWNLHGEHFDDINLASALGCVGRCAVQRPSALQAALSRDALRSGFHSLLARIEERMAHFEPRELVTVMHASSTLPDERARALMSAAAALVREKAARLTPQGMCLAVGACAKQRIVDAELLDAVSAAALSSSPGGATLKQFSPRDISQLVWAYATLGRADVPLFAAIADIAPLKFGSDSVSTQALANTAWAYAKARVDAPQLLDLLGAHALRRVGEFKPFELAMLLWALAKARRPASRLFDTAAEHLGRQLELLPPQSISNTAWAYAKADVRSEPLFRAIAARTPARLGTFSAQALVNLAWAFCVCGFFPAELMGELSRRISALPVGRETPIAYLQQLSQLDNALRLDAPSLGLRLDPELVAACAAAIRSEHLVRKSSNLHLSVSDALRRLNEPHTNEFCVPQLGYFVDIALVQHRLVIEVNDEMWHGRVGEADARGVPAGSQLMKYRHLRASGWRVLVVTDGEWERLAGSLEAETRFLAEEIAAATASKADELARQRSRPPVIWSSAAAAEGGSDDARAATEQTHRRAASKPGRAPYDRGWQVEKNRR